jgi:rubrerythrin
MESPEDEAFNEIERKAKQRMEAVRAAMRVEDDDIQEYKKPWVGLTDEDRWEIIYATEQDDRSDVMRLVEAKLKEKNT